MVGGDGDMYVVRLVNRRAKRGDGSERESGLEINLYWVL